MKSTAKLLQFSGGILPIAIHQRSDAVLNKPLVERLCALEPGVFSSRAKYGSNGEIALLNNPMARTAGREIVIIASNNQHLFQSRIALACAPISGQPEGRGFKSHPRNHFTGARRFFCVSHLAETNQISSPVLCASLSQSKAQHEVAIWRED